jgi:carbon storage regulator
MLIISRRTGESIVIAEDIEIEVLHTGSRRVKLGIKAAKTVPVLRKEVRMTEYQNRAAAQTIPLDLLAPVLSRLRPEDIAVKPGLAKGRAEVTQQCK